MPGRTREAWRAGRGIVEAVRTPIGRRNGELSTMHALDMLGDVQRALFARSDVDPLEVGQLVGVVRPFPADLEDPDLVVEGGQELQVMLNLLAAVDDVPGLGAEVGRRARLGSFGLWGYAVLTSPTFADAVRLGVRFVRPRPR